MYFVMINSYFLLPKYMLLCSISLSNSKASVYFIESKKKFNTFPFFFFLIFHFI